VIRTLDDAWDWYEAVRKLIGMMDRMGRLLDADAAMAASARVVDSFGKPTAAPRQTAE
jgi:hypothetical protein